MPVETICYFIISSFQAVAGHTLEWLPAREEKIYVMEDVQQQVDGADLLSATKASQETVPKYP